MSLQTRRFTRRARPPLRTQAFRQTTFNSHGSPDFRITSLAVFQRLYDAYISRRTGVRGVSVSCNETAGTPHSRGAADPLPVPSPPTPGPRPSSALACARLPHAAPGCPVPCVHASEPNSLFNARERITDKPSPARYGTSTRTPVFSDTDTRAPARDSRWLPGSAILPLVL